MVWVKNNKIFLYQGDTGQIPVFLKGNLQSDDVLYFRIKENLDDDNCLYEQEYTDLTSGTVIVEIDKNTSNLLKNDETEDVRYYYGFKLHRESEQIDTLLAIGDLIVKKGV